jgi:hypothetical protein
LPARRKEENKVREKKTDQRVIGLRGAPVNAQVRIGEAWDRPGEMAVTVEVGEIHLGMTLEAARNLANEILRTAALCESFVQTRRTIKDTVENGVPEVAMLLHSIGAMPMIGTEDMDRWTDDTAHNLVCDCGTRKAPPMPVSAHCGHDEHGEPPARVRLRWRI